MQRYDFVLSGAYKKWNLRYMFALRKVFALVFSELLAHIWYLHLNIICELHFWHTKSLYRSRTDRCLYTILALKKIKKIKKNHFFFYKRHFTQLFSSDARVFKKKLNIFVAPENRPQKLLIIGPPTFFFSIANQPKISPNLIFCSIKMAHCTTSI